MPAYIVAAAHAAAVVFMLTGALLALRWPRVLLGHVPVSVAILAVNLVGVDCPLTTFELWLRKRASGQLYRGGFLHHYGFEPLGIDMASTRAQLGTYAVAVLPNVLGYTLLTIKYRTRGGPQAAPPLPRPQRSGQLPCTARQQDRTALHRRARTGQETAPPAWPNEEPERRQAVAVARPRRGKGVEVQQPNLRERGPLHQWQSPSNDLGRFA